MQFPDACQRHLHQPLQPAVIGLINLLYNLARYEQIVRLKLLLSEPKATDRRLNSKDQDQKRPKTNQRQRIKRQEKTNG